MPVPTNLKKSLIPLGVCFAAAALGIAFGGTDGGPSVSGSGVSVSAARVLVTESVTPACAATTTSERNLVVVTAHMRRDDARAVDALSVTSTGRQWSVRRTEGSCAIATPDGAEWREPCLVESCQADVCALRVPLPVSDAARGSVEATYGSNGKPLGAGAASYGPVTPGSPPGLSVSRKGRRLDVEVTDAPEGSGRVTLVRGGRPLADAPLRYESPGHARLTVPDGVDSVVVAVSANVGGAVRQSSVHLPGPFGESCPGD